MTGAWANAYCEPLEPAIRHSVDFTVQGVAQPAGSKRAFVIGGRAVVADANKRSAPWKAIVRARALEAMEGSPPLEGPLHLSVVFWLPRPKSHMAASGLPRSSAPRYPVTRPDATKLLRGTEDACTGVVWGDDAQIVCQRVEKRYCSELNMDPQVWIVATVLG